MFQNTMNVDGRPVRWALIGEYLHPVHERHDPVGLARRSGGSIRDRLPSVLLQQLGGAPDTGERVFYLVRQHGGHRGH